MEINQLFVYYYSTYLLGANSVSSTEHTVYKDLRHYFNDHVIYATEQY